MSDLSPKNREFCSPKNFSRLMEPIAQLMNEESGKEFDHRARKITLAPYFRAMVLFNLTSAKTLTSLQKSMAEDPLYRLCEAKIEVSVPALSQANASRPMEPFVEILSSVMAAIDQLPGQAKILRDVDNETLAGIKDLLTSTKIIDASSFHLPTKIADWACWSEHNQGGVKLHLKLAGGYGGLEKVVISTSRDNDSKYIDTLLELKEGEGAFYLFDCGYKKIGMFDEITQSGNFLVSKLHTQVGYTVLEEEDLGDRKTPCGYIVHRRMLVTLGSKSNHSVSKYQYVLLEVTDTRGKRGMLVTNMPDATPEQICALYLYRWTVETCFRWLKKTLEMLKFISYSPNGVMMQLLIALIVYGLLVLYQSGSRRFGLTKLLSEVYIDLHKALYEYGYLQGLRAAGQQV